MPTQPLAIGGIQPDRRPRSTASAATRIAAISFSEASASNSSSKSSRLDIAELLLVHGARVDVFVAAMLGEVEIVRAIVDAHPETREATGPHGIPLRAHAEAGGESARAVLELLDAGSRS
jgi:hypothetical protein